MREVPLPVGPQRRLQRGEPVQVVPIGGRHRLSARRVVGQTGEQLAVIRRFGVEIGDVEPEVEAVARRRADGALHGVEPIVACERPRVSEHAAEVAIGQQEAAHRLGRLDELERGLGDHPNLTEAGTDRVEELGMVLRRADDRLAGAGHDLDLDHVVALNPERRGGAADAADDQRATDRQLEVVGQDGRSHSLRQRHVEHLAPLRAGLDDDPVALDGADAPKPRHVRHDAVLDLSAPERRVAVAARREPEAAPAGPADRLGHVVAGRRDQDGLRHPLHEVAEVIGGGAPRRPVEAQLTVQRRQRARPRRGLRRDRHPGRPRGGRRAHDRVAARQPRKTAHHASQPGVSDAHRGPGCAAGPNAPIPECWGTRRLTTEGRRGVGPRGNLVYARSAAAGVVAAARARVARARALHHAAALRAGGAEVEPDHLRGQDRR